MTQDIFSYLPSIPNNWIMWVMLVLLIIAVGLYAFERWSMELTSVGLVTFILFLFALPGAVDMNGQPIGADILLAGFGNPALITIMALLVVGQGMFHTGALDGIAGKLSTSYEKAPYRTLIAAFGTVFLTSAFINNTPVVIVFLPLMVALSQCMGATPSRLLMPVSFVSMLAGMTTLIGTSTNLLAANALTRIDGRMLGFFDLTPIGLVLAVFGLAYIAIAAPWLLPNREAEGDAAHSATGKHFIAQIEVSQHHPLVGARAVAGMFEALPNITVRAVKRQAQNFLPPFADIELQSGDIIIIAATRDALTSLFTTQQNLLHDLRDDLLGSDNQDDQSTKGPLSLSEAVVAPGSRLIARTIAQFGFMHQHRLIVLGVQRRSRMIREHLSNIRLEAGDTLLLCGSPEELDDQRVGRDLLLLDWSRTDLPDVSKAGTARLIVIAMVLAAVSGGVTIIQATMASAVAMIGTSCLNIRQAARALDLRIFLLIGTALCMGTALERTGGADFIANLTVSAAAPYGTAAVASALFLLAALVTNVLSNTATIVIFAPIAIASATQIGVDPIPFLFAVIYGSNCAFATPIAYQTNLLVMAAGHYRFADYIRFGAPLVLILWAVFTAISVWFFNYASTG